MSYFCAQRGCPVPPDHRNTLCPVCNNPLQGEPPSEPTPEPTPAPTPTPTPTANTRRRS